MNKKNIRNRKKKIKKGKRKGKRNIKIKKNEK